MGAWSKAAPIAAIGTLALAGCSSGSSNLEQQLTEVTAERDALQAQVDASAGRYDLVAAHKAEFEAILADTAAYGTPDEVADLLAMYATEDAVMDDDVFGAVNYRDAWYNTLYGDMDASIDTVQQWMNADGSQAGSLWIWHGTNMSGNPFALIGISVIDYDDEGQITNEWVAYPYDDDYVTNAVVGTGTGTDVYGVAWGEADG